MPRKDEDEEDCEQMEIWDGERRITTFLCSRKTTTWSIKVERRGPRMKGTARAIKTEEMCNWDGRSEARLHLSRGSFDIS